MPLTEYIIAIFLNLHLFSLASSQELSLPSTGRFKNEFETDTIVCRK
jgi:hypothetical protein